MTLHRPRGLGWFVTFALIFTVTFVAFYYLTDQDALGAAARFLWNSLAFSINAFFEFVGSVLAWLARGIGLQRVSRIATFIAGVGLGYAGSVIMSEKAVHAAHGWRDKLSAAATRARDAWQNLPLVWKLVVVAVLIMSQVYLHSVLILFPIAFLVPVVRRLWVLIADFVLGSWYWNTFGNAHRAFVAALRRTPVLRSIIGATRVMRIRYLCAWRIWRYDPRYRLATMSGRRISLVEPFRLWRRGELDRYIGRPLLAGPQGGAKPD